VAAGGDTVGVGPAAEIQKWLKEARIKYPGEIPLVAPIPREEEMECVP
jgi:hypothetical protein